MLLSGKFRTSSVWLALLSLSLAFGSGFVVAQDTEEKVDLDSLFQDAATDRNNGDFAASAKKLKQYTKLKDDNGAAWHYLGYSLHMDGKLDEAIVAHTKATEFDQFKQLGLYNLGCAYSLKDQLDKSLKFLHEALDSGFDRFGMLDPESGEWDADLANVRKDKGYQAILDRAKNDGKRSKKVPERIVENKFNPRSLVGTWTVTSGSRQGEEVAKDRLPEITITRRDVTIPAGDNKFVMSYKVVGADEDMIKIDFKIESGPEAEGSALGIMKVDGKQAKLCYDPTGKNRPTEFKTSEEDGCFMFVLEKKARKFNVSKVVGKWNVTKGTRAGEEVDAERLAAAKITIEKDKITIPAGEESFVMSYEINADTTPVQIDMTIESGPAPEGSAAVGILRLRGGKFTLCYNATGGDRPKKFESTEDNGNFLFTMEADKK